MSGALTKRPMRSRLLAILAGLAFLALACPPVDAAPKVVAPAGAELQIEVSKGRLIRLDQPATSVFVADPDVADVQVKSPSLVYVFGKAAGETTLYAVGDGDQVLLNATVVVRHNIERLQQAIQELVPRSAVSASTIDDQLVLEGTVFSAAEGEDIRRLATRFVADPKQLLNKMQVVAPNQVNIRVRVAEVSRSIEKQLGFNWDTAFKFGNFALGLAFAPALSSTLSGVGAVTGSFKSGHASGTALIDALASNGLITILAEPNLSAVSGEPASFLAGGEFPFPVPQSNNTTTVDFKKFGVSLNFVATIAGNDRINLHIAPEVSEISTANQVTICPGTSATTSSCFAVPSLTSRRAETTIELGSGESFAIAGLLQNDITQNLSKFPWLGDLPVLGTLFRSNDFKRNESELVIIVTPYVVRPSASASRLAAPTDGFVPSNDASQVFNGTNYRPQYLKQRVAPASRTGTGLIGPAGFDLD